MLFTFELMKTLATEAIPVRQVIRTMAKIVKRKRARIVREAQEDVIMGKLIEEGLKSGLADKNELYKLLGRI